VCGEHRRAETAAFALHAVNVAGAMGVCAAQAHVYKLVHIAFAGCFFLGGAYAALCQTAVDYGLGNTCSLPMRRIRQGLTRTTRTRVAHSVPIHTGRILLPSLTCAPLTRISLQAVFIASLTHFAHTSVPVHTRLLVQYQGV
jgi:hypothetical protein